MTNESCVNCKHSVWFQNAHVRGGKDYYCIHHLNGYHSGDGKVKHTPCDGARSSGHCGPEARNFEPKQPMVGNPCGGCVHLSERSRSERADFEDMTCHSPRQGIDEHGLYSVYTCAELRRDDVRYLWGLPYPMCGPTGKWFEALVTRPTRSTQVSTGIDDSCPRDGGLKAIETHYNGYRFRSRTEARWAVVFDHLEAGYEYEVEGFELGVTGRYLPDFYFSPGGFKADDYGPNTGVWVEVKGSSPTLDEVVKLEALCKSRRQYGYILVGSPNKVRVISISDEGVLSIPDKEGLDALVEPVLWSIGQQVGRCYGRDDAVEAVKAAMSARFEFG